MRGSFFARINGAFRFTALSLAEEEMISEG